MPGASLDGIDFAAVPYVDRYSWVQREYYRLVQKHAHLLLATGAARGSNESKN